MDTGQTVTDSDSLEDVSLFYGLCLRPTMVSYRTQWTSCTSSLRHDCRRQTTSKRYTDHRDPDEVGGPVPERTLQNGTHSPRDEGYYSRDGDYGDWTLSVLGRLEKDEGRDDEFPARGGKQERDRHQPKSGWTTLKELRLNIASRVA